MHKHIFMTLGMLIVSSFWVSHAGYTTTINPLHDGVYTHTIASHTPDQSSNFSITFPTTGIKPLDQEILRQSKHYRSIYRNTYQKDTYTSGSYTQEYDIILDNREYFLMILNHNATRGDQSLNPSYHTILFDKKTNKSIEYTALKNPSLTNESFHKHLQTLANTTETIVIQAYTLHEHTITYYIGIPSLNKTTTITLKYYDYPRLLNISYIHGILSPQTSHSRNLHPTDCTQNPCVALTFDDGPGPYTLTLLSYLKKYNIPATFFLLGTSVQKHPEIVTQIAHAGHELGNHSRDHADFKTLSAAAIHEQLSWTDDEIYKSSGQYTTLFRPPYGSYTHTIASYIDKALILRNVDPRDRQFRNTQSVIQRVSQANAGSIILLHDIHHTSVEAVPSIIENLRAKGYQFVTVSQLLGSIESGKIYTHQK